ncbi:reticulon-like protein B12 isoform X2 [Spinacia oleracea]|nr:reticulon-like protein B12 isoform X2 [Spinacia oleracea]
MGILLMILTVWLAFEQSGYTLLSLTSSVLLLLITILFVWSKAASLLNRPAPPLPDMYLSKELVAEVGELARKNINVLVLVCRNVALGKDSRLFLRVAACLLLISVVGGFTDIVSLCYFCKFPLHIDCGLTTNRNIFWYFTTNRAVKFMDFPQFGES